jgi:hypothetical protein
MMKTHQHFIKLVHQISFNKKFKVIWIKEFITIQ